MTSKEAREREDQAYECAKEWEINPDGWIAFIPRMMSALKEAEERAQKKERELFYHPKPESIRIAHGNDIVNEAKLISRRINAFTANPHKVDYLGASRSYVLEKIYLAIQSLKWLEEIVKKSDIDREGE